jgi:Cu/Ag efflux pump CusA
MIVRGSLERLTPVLMTALVAAFALTPLLLAADAPGKEILHPVAVVIFGGLVSSTLLDTLLTPVLFWRAAMCWASTSSPRSRCRCSASTARR